MLTSYSVNLTRPAGGRKASPSQRICLIREICIATVKGDGMLGQGNRVLSEEDLQQVVLSPSCLQSFALDAHFQAGFPLQQVVGNLP